MGLLYIYLSMDGWFLWNQLVGKYISHMDPVGLHLSIRSHWVWKRKAIIQKTVRAAKPQQKVAGFHGKLPKKLRLYNCGANFKVSNICIIHQHHSKIVILLPCLLLDFYTTSFPFENVSTMCFPNQLSPVSSTPSQAIPTLEPPQTATVWATAYVAPNETCQTFVHPKTSPKKAGCKPYKYGLWPLKNKVVGSHGMDETPPEN